MYEVRTASAQYPAIRTNTNDRVTPTQVSPSDTSATRRCATWWSARSCGTTRSQPTSLEPMRRTMLTLRPHVLHNRRTPHVQKHKRNGIAQHPIGSATSANTLHRAASPLTIALPLKEPQKQNANRRPPHRRSSRCSRGVRAAAKGVRACLACASMSSSAAPTGP